VVEIESNEPLFLPNTTFQRKDEISYMKQLKDRLRLGALSRGASEAI